MMSQTVKNTHSACNVTGQRVHMMSQRAKCAQSMMSQIDEIEYEVPDISESEYDVTDSGVHFV